MYTGYVNPEVNEDILSNMFEIRSFILKLVNNDEADLTEEEVLELCDSVIDYLEE
jgi:hypothetical protein